MKAIISNNFIFTNEKRGMIIQGGGVNQGAGIITVFYETCSLLWLDRVQRNSIFQLALRHAVHVARMY